MNAYLLSIGDELASGLTINTNSAWLAERLGRLGIPAAAHVTVGDDLQAITAAIRDASGTLTATAAVTLTHNPLQTFTLTATESETSWAWAGLRRRRPSGFRCFAGKCWRWR